MDRFYIKNVSEGQNSVLFEIPNYFIFYEKLANTIHKGGIELKDLQKKVESIDYNTKFESDSLMKKKDEKLEALVLNVTESCNLSCSYCIYSGNYENERRENNSNMTFETAKKSIDFFMPKSRNPVLISFYGGEPLNNFNLIEKIINYTKERYPEKESILSMTSNFCDADKYIEEIIKNNIYINISLDGPKKIHDKNRKFKNGRPTYNKILTNIKKFPPKFAKTNFAYNITCSNSNDLCSIIEFFKEQRHFFISRINMVESKGLIKDIREDKGEIIFSFLDNYLESILLKKDPGILKNIFDQDLKNIANRSKEAMPKKLMLNGSCYPGNRKLFVDTLGTFYMCEKFGKRVSIGNLGVGINENLVKQAIDKFLNIRNHLCATGCWAQRICNSCIQSSKDPKGDISEEGLKYTCSSSKSRILMSLANYTKLLEEDKILTEKYLNSLKFN